ncbi:hypothetical protein CC80DRAFT_501525 [Byssothecium circinans]|uniref:EthD domain-containing protein n=1 Tax=Byssothecium circinans TaxID=147558 RepID=A0A6A5U6H4_9PLEO|nr:hypothetical protein CC80DRAFT_501525 [Byssothecium circinans]
MATPPSWTGPGLMQSFMALTPSSELTQSVLDTWFETVYIPAILQTGIVSSASTWKVVNPAYKNQFMVLYTVPDLTPVKEGKLKEEAVSQKSDLFPGGRSVDEFIGFESRILKEVERFEKGDGGKISDTTAIIYAAMQPSTPSGEIDLDAWYRQEHNEQMSKEPGYVRTMRYRQLFHTRNDGTAPSGLDFVALHEFGEGNRLGKDAEPLQPVTEWTKKCMGECKSIDAAIYRRVKTFGG